MQFYEEAPNGMQQNKMQHWLLIFAVALFCFYTYFLAGLGLKSVAGGEQLKTKMCENIKPYNK